MCIFNLAFTLSAFLRRPANTTIAEVTGSKVNRGAGYGLEVLTMHASTIFSLQRTK